uniref:subtilisin n=1 Tax=Zooxanthella nutricula TaxID=1333877 RepID=A0A7S2JWU3_9DINO
MGITVIVSSGDEGAWLNDEKTKLRAEFPATSQWVTAVGGTVLSDDNRTEQAWNGGGGGFSWSDPRPTWQDGAVEKYFTVANKSKPFPSEEMYNPKGRGVPDVSAFAANLVVVYPEDPGPHWDPNGTYFGIQGGTSAAAPVFAALVSLLNGERARCHGKRLGFLNPLLYAHAEAFTDITSGSNLGADEWGYTAVKGWDPATGLGSPLFDKLLAAVKSSAGLTC